MKTIVVGVDGSEGGEAALEFAAHAAAAHGARLRVVCAWQIPHAMYTEGFVPAPDFRETVERDAMEIARRAADRAVELEPGVYAEHEAVEGYAAERLVAEARDALLVVVGSRGRGGLASMLLGSVSKEVARHTLCPVVIVPKPRMPQLRRLRHSEELVTDASR